MTAIQLRSRHLDSAGVGINALTVEVYATDGDGLPTGAAVASTTTNVNGVWEFLTATGLLHSTRYCVKITNGAEVMWLDSSDMIQCEELAVRTMLTLPDGTQVNAATDVGEFWLSAASNTIPNGVLTAFNIGAAVASTKVRVFVNGLLRRLTTDYTFTTTENHVDFVWAPETGDDVRMDYVAA